MTQASSPPVTVLQVLAQDDLGGTELMLASLIERLDARRVSCELGLLSTAGPIATRLGAGGIRVHALGGGGAGRTAIGLARLLRRGGYDVVNAYGLRAGLAVRVIARLVSPRTRVVIGVRGLLVTEVEELASPKAKLALWLERATSRLVDLYDSNSRGAAELIVSLGIDSGRVRYIPNGLDLDLWPANGAKGSTQGPPLVASVARFVSRKRHQDLLHALALLNSAGVPFRAVLAGAGPTLETCRGLSVELGLEDRVEFPGRIAPDQVAELLEHAQVGCLSSLWEGMPGFVMEAMAARLPVVATAVNGPDELVVDGQTGFLVPAKDPEAMMQALRTLLEQPALAARFGQAGRDRIERDFSLDSMVTAKQSLYEGLVAR